MQTPRTMPLWVIVLALILPTAVTYIYFIALATSPAEHQQRAYQVGKAIQFLLPVAAVFWSGRRISLQRTTTKNQAIGFGFGLVLFLAIIALQRMLQDTAMMTAAMAQVKVKVLGLGIDTFWKFATVGAFYAVIHSLLEEYYWRWFVFHELNHRFQAGLFGRNGISNARAFSISLIISSLGFMAHHVIVLAIYFSWSSFWTYFFSFSVAVGGAVWAWLYHRSGSLVPTWISHSLVDMAIFVAGWNMIAAGMNK